MNTIRKNLLKIFEQCSNESNADKQLILRDIFVQIKHLSEDMHLDYDKAVANAIDVLGQ